MADTLFNEAAAQADTAMQCVALCAKLDYYYYQPQPSGDSIRVWTERVQEFARENSQLIYYYYVWSARLINYYLNAGEYNTALFEAKRMLSEVQKDHYDVGTMDCYSALANIYRAKGLWHIANEYDLQEIAIFEQSNGEIERYNISTRYLYAAAYAMEEQSDSLRGAEYLRKATAYVQNDITMASIEIHYITLYTMEKRYDDAYEILDKYATTIETEEELLPLQREYYAQEANYYERTRQYRRALAAVSSWKKALAGEGVNRLIPALKREAGIYWEMGSKDRSAQIYRDIIDITKTVDNNNFEENASEIAILLQRNALEEAMLVVKQEMQARQIRNLHIEACLLGLAMLVVSYLLFRQLRMSGALRRAQSALKERNEKLERYGRELQVATAAAEQSSQMKTAFIQHMSHEIRTPLNAIVGFSAVLAMMQHDDERAAEVATQITAGSDSLLKMINERLDDVAYLGGETKDTST
jgi:tetratricopeptide (TPR) repeat protein